MRYEIRIRIHRRFEGGRIALRLPVAIKTVCRVGESQRQLRSFRGGKFLCELESSRGQSLGNARSVPKRYLSLTFAQPADRRN